MLETIEKLIRGLQKLDPAPFFIAFIGVLLDIFTTRFALTLPNLYESRPFGNNLWLELGLYFLSIAVIQGMGILFSRYRLWRVGRALSYLLALLPYTAVINNLEALKL